MRKVLKSLMSLLIIATMLLSMVSVSFATTENTGEVVLETAGIEELTYKGETFTGVAVAAKAVVPGYFMGWEEGQINYDGDKFDFVGVKYPSFTDKWGDSYGWAFTGAKDHEDYVKINVGDFGANSYPYGTQVMVTAYFKLVGSAEDYAGQTATFEPVGALLDETVKAMPTTLTSASVAFPEVEATDPVTADIAGSDLDGRENVALSFKGNINFVNAIATGTDLSGITLSDGTDSYDLTITEGSVSAGLVSSAVFTTPVLKAGKTYTLSVPAIGNNAATDITFTTAPETYILKEDFTGGHNSYWTESSGSIPLGSGNLEDTDSDGVVDAMWGVGGSNRNTLRFPSYVSTEDFDRLTVETRVKFLNGGAGWIEDDGSINSFEGMLTITGDENNNRKFIVHTSGGYFSYGGGDGTAVVTDMKAYIDKWYTIKVVFNADESAAKVTITDEDGNVYEGEEASTKYGSDWAIAPLSSVEYSYGLTHPSTIDYLYIYESPEEVEPATADINKFDLNGRENVATSFRGNVRFVNAVETGTDLSGITLSDGTDTYDISFTETDTADGVFTAARFDTPVLKAGKTYTLSIPAIGNNAAAEITFTTAPETYILKEDFTGGFNSYWTGRDKNLGAYHWLFEDFDSDGVYDAHSAFTGDNWNTLRFPTYVPTDDFDRLTFETRVKYDDNDQGFMNEDGTIANGGHHGLFVITGEESNNRKFFITTNGDGYFTYGGDGTEVATTVKAYSGEWYTFKLIFNEDETAAKLTITDKDGNVYEGAEASVKYSDWPINLISEIEYSYNYFTKATIDYLYIYESPVEAKPATADINKFDLNGRENVATSFRGNVRFENAVETGTDLSGITLSDGTDTYDISFTETDTAEGVFTAARFDTPVLKAGKTYTLSVPAIGNNAAAEITFTTAPETYILKEDFTGGFNSYWTGRDKNLGAYHWLFEDFDSDGVYDAHSAFTGDNWNTLRFPTYVPTDDFDRLTFETRVKYDDNDQGFMNEDGTIANGGHHGLFVITGEESNNRKFIITTNGDGYFTYGGDGTEVATTVKAYSGDWYTFKLIFNEDETAAKLTITDKDGNVYEGAEASVKYSDWPINLISEIEYSYNYFTKATIDYLYIYESPEVAEPATADIAGSDLDGRENVALSFKGNINFVSAIETGADLSGITLSDGTDSYDLTIAESDTADGVFKELTFTTSVLKAGKTYTLSVPAIGNNAATEITFTTAPETYILKEDFTGGHNSYWTESTGSIALGSGNLEDTDSDGVVDAMWGVGGDNRNTLRFPTYISTENNERLTVETRVKFLNGGNGWIEDDGSINSFNSMLIIRGETSSHRFVIHTVDGYFSYGGTGSDVVSDMKAYIDKWYTIKVVFNADESAAKVTITDEDGNVYEGVEATTRYTDKPVSLLADVEYSYGLTHPSTIDYLYIYESPEEEEPQPEGEPCGPNAFYTLENGVLTITGTGDITSVPWADSYAEITEINIAEGITNIPNQAFPGTAITEVTIPSTVTSIGNYAFMNCASLTTVNMSAGATIGSYTFSDCTSLATVNYTGSVEAYKAAIETYASRNVPFLRARATITDGDNVSYASMSIYATWVYMPATKTLEIGQCPGVAARVMLNYKTNTSMPWYEFLNEIETVKVDGVLSVGSRSMIGAPALKTLEIAEPVQTVNAWSFYNAKALENIKLPATITAIGTGAFYGSKFTNVESAASFDAYNKVTFGDSTDDFKRAEIKLADAVRGMQNDSGTGTIIWTLKDGVLTVSGTGKMLNKTAGSGQPWYKYNDQITKVVVEAGVTFIGKYAFAGLTNVVTATLPETVTDIQANAFDGCTSLVSVDIPKSVENIYGSVFNGCENFTTVNYAGSTADFWSKTFASTTKTFLQSKTIVADDNVYVANGNVTDTMFWKLTDTGVLYIEGSGAMPNYSTSSKPGWNSYKSNITAVVIKNGVTSIGAQAFGNATKLITIDIPASLTSVGKQATYGCSALTTINYAGTQAQFEAITVGTSNDPFTNATVNYAN